MSDLQPILSDEPRIIHIADVPLIVNLKWHPYFYSLNNTKKLIAKKSPSDAGVFYSTDLLTQVSFVGHDLIGSFSPTRPIIEHVLENNSLNSLWFFYTTADLDDDTAYVLICDQDGVINDGKELFLSEYEFYELLDEHILVSEGKLNVFTDNFAFIDEFGDQENINLSKIDFTSENFFASGEIVKLSSRKVFGLPPVLFHLLTILVVLTILIQVSGRFIQAPEYSFITEPRKIPDKIDEDPEWAKLEKIFDNTMPSDLFLKNYFNSKGSILTILPTNIPGWDLSNITLDKNIVAFNLSMASKFTSISDLQTQILDNSEIYRITSPLTGTVMKINNDRRSLFYSFLPVHSENVFNGMTLSNYKDSLSRDDIDIKIKESNRLIDTIVALNSEGDFLHEKYIDVGSIELLLGFFTGSLVNDTNKMEDLSSEGEDLLNQFNKMKKYIYDVPTPDEGLIASIIYNDLSEKKRGYIKNTSLFSISQKTNLFSITEGKKFDKYSTFNLNITAKNSEELKYKLNELSVKYELPIRFNNIIYAWKTSNWTLKGEIYAN